MALAIKYDFARKSEKKLSWWNTSIYLIIQKSSALNNVFRKRKCDLNEINFNI